MKSKPRVKIIDFGLSQIMMKNERLFLEVGTLFYQAPEIFLGNYDQKVDIWSLGVIFYILVTGVPPFISMKQKKGTSEIYLDKGKTKRKILGHEVNYERPGFKNFCPEVKDILKMILVRDPSRRPSTEELLDLGYFRDLPRSSLVQEGLKLFFNHFLILWNNKYI